MATREKKRRPDPVIQEYVGTDVPFHLLLSNVPEPRSQVVASLLLIQECLHGRRLARDAIRSARAASSRSADPELMILMLSSWAELACRLGTPAEAQALIHRARALIAASTHPEIVAACLRAESILAGATGNNLRQEKTLQELLEDLPAGAPRRKYHLWDYAFFLAQQGRGVETKQQLPELLNACTPQFPEHHVLLVPFVNAIETGHIQEADRLRARIGKRTDPPLLSLYRGYCHLLGAFLNQRAPHPITMADAPGTPPAWVGVVRRLLSRQPQEALQLARLEANKLLSSVFSTGFDSFSLIRAELASGAAEGATRLLRMRQTRGNVHYLDDFFRARAALLTGNREEAAERFAETLSTTEYYDATQRLDMELQMACELLPGQLVELTRAAERAMRPRNRKSGKSKKGQPSPPRTEAQPEPSEPRPAIARIIGVSDTVTRIKESVLRFASLEAPVLITGDTGTGKELIARALHEAGTRAREPFTPVNCASMTETLLESELFGHERGAFTGAERANKGLFEATGKGTIFLDEIGDITPRLQTALLRVLESGEIRAVGSAQTRKINCRIVAATNADLDERASEGRFRTDLLFRLRRLVLQIAPLRERTDDIIPLARHFLDMGRPPGIHSSLSPDFADAVTSYDWPGNVRELRNVMERTRLLHSDKLDYDRDDLDIKLRSMDAPNTSTPPPTALESPFHLPTSPAPAPAGTHAQTMPQDAFLRHGRSPMRREDHLRELFTLHGKLTRSEVMTLLSVSANTATKYLKRLCDQEWIKRVEPTASTRSHYFVLHEEE